MRLGALALLPLLLLGACASSEKRPRFLDEPARAEAKASPDTGGCRPFFVDSPLWSDAQPPKHSCWNLAWEIPVAIVTVPLALGVLTAPVWVPLVLLH